jgi:hypothetical protein
MPALFSIFSVISGKQILLEDKTAVFNPSNEKNHRIRRGYYVEKIQ